MVSFRAAIPKTWSGICTIHVATCLTVQTDTPLPSHIGAALQSPRRQHFPRYTQAFRRFIAFVVATLNQHSSTRGRTDQLAITRVRQQRRCTPESSPLTPYK